MGCQHPMLAHAVANAAIVDYVSAVDEAIYQSGGHDLVAEVLVALLQRSVAGRDGLGGHVAAADRLEEQPSSGA